MYIYIYIYTYTYIHTYIIVHNTLGFLHYWRSHAITYYAALSEAALSYAWYM